MRNDDLLTVSYEILGDLDKTVQPSAAAADQEPVPFWHTTQLKCFVALEDAPHYWEFQLQPDYNWVECFSPQPTSAWDFQISHNHDWSILRYDNYRLNPQRETNIHTVSYSLLSSPQALHTLLKIDLSKLSLTNRPLKIGLAAIAKLADKHTTYWALAYPQSGPDFHHPESFALPI